MDLDRYITVKRNIRKAHHIDETGVTLDNVRELIDCTEDAKQLARFVYQSTPETNETHKLASDFLNKYFKHTKGE